MKRLLKVGSYIHINVKTLISESKKDLIAVFYIQMRAQTLFQKTVFDLA